MFGKLRLAAQVIGFLVMGMLVFFGAQSLLSGNAPVLAAIGLVDPTPQAPQAADAIAPTTLGYVGYLKDDAGTPLNDVYTMTFRIYDSASNPTSLWSETQTDISVSGGVYNVVLGATTPFPSDLFTNPSRYLGITVAGYAGELTPRQQFASVPFSLRAERASGLSAADGDPADAVFVDNAGNVGIGTTSPSAKLEVVGIVRGEFNSTNYVEIGHGGTNGYINQMGAGNLDFRKEGSTLMSLTQSGNLGIGTTVPSAKLDVVGNIEANGSITTTGNISWDRATGHLTGFDISASYVVSSTGDYATEVMTPLANSICYLTEVRLSSNANGMCSVITWSDNWVLQAYLDGTRCQARCLQW